LRRRRQGKRISKLEFFDICSIDRDAWQTGGKAQRVDRNRRNGGGKIVATGKPNAYGIVVDGSRQDEDVLIAGSGRCEGSVAARDRL
jgi:hypothetical protein